jgi:hypothetical protein
MNIRTLTKIEKRWGAKVKTECHQLDEQMRGERGPVTLVGTYSLVAGLVYLALEQKPVHLRTLARELAGARNRDLRVLDLTTRPSYRQLCYQLERLQRHLASTHTSTKHNVQHPMLDQLLDVLVAGSTENVEAHDTWAIDTHLFAAWVNQSTSHSADPDAGWRVMNTHKHKNGPVLGYQLVAAVRADGTEVCDRIRIIPANHDDATPGVATVHSLQQSGAQVERVIADRGFTQKPALFLDPLRNAGVHLTFDLKESDIGVSSTYKGALIIDGWPHSPGLPAHLKVIKRPGLGAKKTAWDTYNKKMKQREAYQYLPHATPGVSSARVASPAHRKQIGCRAAKIPTPNGAPTCRVAHAPGDACGLKTMTFSSSVAPRTFQFPVYGTKDWNEIWRKRSAVERFFGHLQSDHGAAFRAGRFRVRRLIKVAIATCAFVIATNLQLREQAATKARANATPLTT